MMSRTTVSSFQAELAEESAAPEQMVKVALNIAASYHEMQFARLQALQDGAKPRVFDKMVAIYEEFLAQSENSEEAFVLFLKYITQ